MSKRGDRTTRVVTGALVACIHDHGSITHDTLPSAVKRVVAQIRAEGNRILQVEGAGATEATEHRHKQLQKLRHGHGLTLSQFDRCRAERDRYRAALESIAYEPVGDTLEDPFTDDDCTYFGHEGPRNMMDADCAGARCIARQVLTPPVTEAFANLRPQQFPKEGDDA